VNGYVNKHIRHVSFAPFPQEAVEHDRPRTERHPRRRRCPFPVVVAGGAFSLEAVVVSGGFSDGADPVCLRLGGRFDALHTHGSCATDDGPDVFGLLLQDVDEVDRVGVLKRTELEEVREAVRVEPVEGSGTLRPRFEQGLPVAADYGKRAGDDTRDARLEAVAKMTQSTSYSSSPTTIPVSVILVMPAVSAVSTSVTLGRLKVCRYGH